MKTTRVRMILLLMALFFVFISSNGSFASRPPDDLVPPAIVPAAALWPGTILTGVSPMGERDEAGRPIPTRFTVEVLKSYRFPGQTIVLAKIVDVPSSSPLKLGVHAGQSGSPLTLTTLDGRTAIAGALSYRVTNITGGEIIFGFTPFEEMWRELVELPLLASTTNGDDAAISTTSTMPVALLTNADASGIRAIEDLFLRRGVTATVTPAATNATAINNGSENQDIQAGDPIVVGLATGDFFVGAMGTTTAVVGDRIFAFGHPFLGAGTLSAGLPFWVGEITTSNYDQLQPFLFFQKVEPWLGAIVEDRGPGILGIIGKEPRMIDVVVIAEFGAGSFLAADIGGVTPTLIKVGLGSLLAGKLPPANPLKFSVVVKSYNADTLEFSVARTGKQAPDVFGDLSSVIARLQDAGFSLRSVRVTVEPAEGSDRLLLEELVLVKPAGMPPQAAIVTPGSTVTIDILLRSRSDETRSRLSLTLPIPKDVAAGQATVVVLSGEQSLASALFKERQEMPSLTPRPRTNAELFEFIRMEQAPGNIVTVLVRWPTGAPGANKKLVQSSPDGPVEPTLQWSGPDEETLTSRRQPDHVVRQEVPGIVEGEPLTLTLTIVRPPDATPNASGFFKSLLRVVTFGIMK